MCGWEPLRGCQRRLRVEDDLWDLAVLHRRAVVVSRRVAEGEAGFGAGAGRLVRDLPHAFSAVVRVWTLRQKTERERERL